MERNKKWRVRRLLAAAALTSVMVWTSGCTSGQMTLLSALLPAEEQSPIHYEETDGTNAVYIPETDAAGEELATLPADEAEDPDATDDEESYVPIVEEEQEDAILPAEELKRAALTFDDGPDAKYTTAILDILKEKGVKATFFVVGTQVEKYPEVMKRIKEEGHAIGNHTQAHKNLRELGRSGILQQITQADEAIEAAVGYTPSLFRAPYGAVSDMLIDELEDEDRRLVGWTVDTRDWAGTSIPEMREMIRKETESNGIILMHSFGGKYIRNTVEMLPDIIDDLQELGFTLVTVDQIQE